MHRDRSARHWPKVSEAWSRAGIRAVRSNGRSRPCSRPRARPRSASSCPPVTRRRTVGDDRRRRSAASSMERFPAGGRDHRGRLALHRRRPRRGRRGGRRGWWPRTTSPAAAAAARQGRGDVECWPSPAATSSASSTPTSNFDPRLRHRPARAAADRPGHPFVKGFYDRPLTPAAYAEPGRRPGHRAGRPAAAQPALAGAGRLRAAARPASTPPAGRSLERVPFVSGYGVEIAVLVDLLGPSGSTRSPRWISATRTAPQPGQRRAGPDGRADPAHRLVAAARQGRGRRESPAAERAAQFGLGGAAAEARPRDRRLTSASTSGRRVTVVSAGTRRRPVAAPCW